MKLKSAAMVRIVDMDKKRRKKIGMVETAAEFFKRRAQGAKGKGLGKFLRKAPKVAPAPEDAIGQK